jgi:hypothetical protein
MINLNKPFPARSFSRTDERSTSVAFAGVAASGRAAGADKGLVELERRLFLRSQPGLALLNNL